jgi:hypothetical protein
MLSINLIDGLVIRSFAGHPGKRMILAIASSFDVILVVLALYYWLLVRPGIRAPGSMVAITLTGMLRATYFYPNALAIRGIVGGLCEAGLLGFVLVQVRRSARRTLDKKENIDPLDAIRKALTGVSSGVWMEKLITAELGILYYALFSWYAKPHVSSAMRAFTIYQRVGQADLLGALTIGCVLELLPLHLLLKHWSSSLAWTATGVGLYGVIWLIGMARAIQLRPVLVAPDYLLLRYGLLFELRVPKAMLTRVRRADVGDRVFAVPRKSQPTICIELAEYMDAEGPFGIRKRVNRIAITPDDEPTLQEALAELMNTE